jgi:hypothetical protein
MDGGLARGKAEVPTGPRSGAVNLIKVIKVTQMIRVWEPERVDQVGARTARYPSAVVGRRSDAVGDD